MNKRKQRQRGPEVDYGGLQVVQVRGNTERGSYIGLKDLQEKDHKSITNTSPGHMSGWKMPISLRRWTPQTLLYSTLKQLFKTIHQ